MTNVAQDIKDYLNANPDKFPGKSPKDLTPRQKFRAFLEWNGIMGYEQTMVGLFKELGWKPPKDW